MKPGPGTVYAGGHHGRVASTRDPVARWAGIARQAQDATGIPANVLLGLIRVESGGREGETSSAGAGGLTQFIRSTAHEYGVDVRPGHARSQILGAAKYLARLGFNRNPQQALNAYNGAQTIGGRANPYAGNVLSAAKSYGNVPASSSSALVSAAGGSSGSSSSPGPSFGAANDVSGAVAALLSSARQSGPPVSGPAPPAYAAHAVMPQGYAPVASAPPVQTGPDVQALLDAVRTQGGSVPGAGAPSGSQTVNGGSGATSGGGSVVASGHSPVAGSGKIIGTPYTGTHTLGNWQSDRAYDIGVPKGTPMVAVQDGTIVKVTKHPQGAGRFAGDQITVKGANGNEYFYAHGVASVRPGERVRRGQQLGVTGSANGVEHLHFAQMSGDPSLHVRPR